VNALDGYDTANALLSRRAMRRLVTVVVGVTMSLIAVGALSTDQVGAFLFEQSRQRTEQLLEPLLAKVDLVTTVPTTAPPAIGD
jgi:hypothetical protein